MTFLRTVSIALCWVSVAEGTCIDPNKAEPCDAAAGEAETLGSFVTPAGWVCSSGVRGSNWQGYLLNWLDQTAKTVDECWAAAVAEYPEAQGVMFLNVGVCRAMNNFANLEQTPDGELLAEYPDYQGSGGICMKVKATDAPMPAPTPAPKIQVMDAASHIHGSFVMTVSLAAALLLF